MPKPPDDSCPSMPFFSSFSPFTFPNHSLRFFFFFILFFLLCPFLLFSFAKIIAALLFPLLASSSPFVLICFPFPFYSYQLLHTILSLFHTHTAHSSQLTCSLRRCMPSLPPFHPSIHCRQAQRPPDARPSSVHARCPGLAARRSLFSKVALPPCALSTYRLPNWKAF